MHDSVPWAARPGSERDLVRAAASGDLGARQRLIESLAPQLHAMARPYRGLPSVDHAELMQEGVVGVLAALRNYDPDRGTRFWSYACWWVRQAMQSLVCELTGPVVLSDRATRELSRLKHARRQELQASGREPSTAELAALTGLSIEHVGCLRAIEAAARTLDEPFGGDDGSSSSRLGDQIADPQAEDPYERVLDQLPGHDVGRLPDHLEARERQVVRARYGFGQQPQTLREIAAVLHVSSERVRQIEERALTHLREIVLQADGAPDPRCAAAA